MYSESNRVELKEKLNDKLEKEVVAFLNNKEGGIIYIGIADDGKVLGVENLDSEQCKIADRIKNNIQPSTLGLFDVSSEEIEGKQVIKIIISSGVEKPYYLREKGMSPSGCYLRIGTTSQPMDSRQIEDLFSKRVHNTLRNIIAPRQDLTFSQLKIYYEEKGMQLNDRFADTLELKTTDGKYNYIAYLLADENGVSIKVAKYAGKDKDILVQNEEYGYCSLIKATNKVLDKFDIENITFAKITPKERIEKNLVAKIPLREAIINAIVHNDYTREIPPLFEIFSDRIVITSFGGLMIGQSEDDFFSFASMPRNRELMRVFKDLGLVEHLGSGMTRILKEYDKSIFDIKENFIKVTFKFDEEIDTVNRNDTLNDTVNDTVKELNTLNQLQLSIIDLIDKNRTITQKEMAEQLNIGIATVKRNLKDLKEKNIIERVGSDKKGCWKIIK